MGKGTSTRRGAVATSSESPLELARRLLESLECAGSDVLSQPHLRWQLGEMMKHIDFLDLSPAELAGVIIFLTPAHSRFLTGEPPPGTLERGGGLHLVR